jgi:hypothetical protein
VLGVATAASLLSRRADLLQVKTHEAEDPKPSNWQP